MFFQSCQIFLLAFLLSFFGSASANAQVTSCQGQSDLTPCVGGVCFGGSCLDFCAGVTCVGGDTCTPNQCNPFTGGCELSPAPDGTQCDTGNAATQGREQCLAGSCVSYSVNPGEISCGDTVGPQGTYLLAENLVCPSDPAFTVVGPVKVDFQGYKVRCLSSSLHGIQIEGNQADLHGGGVMDCADGIYTDGTGGRHRLTDIVSAGHAGDGVRIDGDRNRLKRVTASRNAGDGIEINGDKNHVTHSVASANEGQGYKLAGDGNRFARNSAAGNIATGAGGRGFDITGDGNRINRNVSGGNSNWGFSIEGDKNVVSRNSSQGNQNYGMRISGDQNSIRHNTSLGNDNQGFSLSGNRNTLHKNTANGNDNRGFSVSGTNWRVTGNEAWANRSGGIVLSATDSVVSGNSAVGNDNADLLDNNGTGCDANQWTRNWFGTSDPAQPSCIE